MGDVEAFNRKRKLSEECIIQVSDEEDCLEISSESIDLEIVEPSPKLKRLEEESSQNSDSNLGFVALTSNSNKEVVTEEVDLKQKLLQLEDEIKRLKQENEELKTKQCLCGKVQEDEEAIASIMFKNAESYNLYKSRLLKDVKESLEINVNEDESSLLIVLSRERDICADEWVVVDKSDLPDSKSRVRKKNKKSKTKTTAIADSLFTLDTTPSLATKTNLQYESKFTVVVDNKVQEEDQKTQACFNCNENHNLRDCPKPKNHSKINMARQKFKSQQPKTVRYHLEDDQRYAHLKPGKISTGLQEALGLRRSQLPEYIYKMRLLGYPPGWMDEVCNAQSSNLVLFDFQGNSEFSKKNQIQEVHADKVVEYPGFNAPMEKGVKDDFMLFRCPPYSKDISKENMIKYIENCQRKSKDNLETCDMDIENPPCNKTVQSLKEKETKAHDSSRSSPTLVELECEKQKLLAELSEDTDSTLPTDDKLEDPVFKTIDSTGVVDEELSETIDDTIEGTTDTESGSQSQDMSCNDTSMTSIVKTSSFGTPVLKSSTLHCKLPEADKFCKGISPVINFENLPNSTGKYEQMVTVLEKVRKTLKNLNEQKS